MATVHDVSEGKGLVNRLLTTDFCPWANRFVYWLKEPVGWFFLATVVCLIVGQYVAPIGWTMATALISLITIGMLWPAIAVRAVACSLSSDHYQCHEGSACDLKLTARNRIPVPIWGLAIEGYLDRKSNIEDEKIPTVALAFVRANSTTTYRFTVHPEQRGRYPDGEANITCSFPFGIWTAKKQLKDISPVMVWPRVSTIAGQKAAEGKQRAEIGEGNRPGRTGDLLGVREYRQGDGLRDVNWRATAKTGDLIVTQRSGPQCASVEVFVDTTGSLDQEILSDRIRVAASVVKNLHDSSTPLRLQLGERGFQVQRGWDGMVQMMDALALVPLDGIEGSHLPPPSNSATAITIASNSDGDVSVCLSEPTVNPRLRDVHTHRTLSRSDSIEAQLASLWTEVRDANLVA